MLLHAQQRVQTDNGCANMAEAAAIPIIDISADGADELEVARALVDAAAEYGFVYIKNTGKDITAKQVEDAFSIVSDTVFGPSSFASFFP